MLLRTGRADECKIMDRERDVKVRLKDDARILELDQSFEQ